MPFKIAPLVALLALSVNVDAALRTPNVPNTTFSWSGSGDISDLSNLFCVTSTDGNRSGPAIPYTVTVVDRNTPGGPAPNFFLKGDNGQILPVILRWIDTADSNQEPTLQYGSPSVPMTGGQRQGGTNCGNTGGNNSQFEITVPENSFGGFDGLSSVPNGRYQTRFRMTWENNEPDDDSDNFRIRVNRNVEEVRITGLPAALNLGTLTPGSGAYTSSTNALQFCVYSSSGDYTIRADGNVATDGSNGTFALDAATVAGPPQIEYTVNVDDAAPFNASAQALINGITGSVSLTAQDTDPACTGGVNSSIQLTIVEQEINQAVPDTYSGTLVLTVAPI